jgi:hypothetical protein
MTKKKTIIPRKYEDLTLKQRRFIKFYLKSGNGTEAALKAYDTTDRVTAAAIASQNLRKLREPVKMLMEAKGLSLGRLLEVLDDGLRADRVISAVKGKEATGATNDFIEVPDHKARHAFLQTAGRWLGIEGKKGPEVAISGSQFNFFDVSSEKRAEWNKRFSKFVKKEAFNTEVFEAEEVKEKEG